MVKKKVKTGIKENSRELKVPIWLVDGFNGILGLMIYNFVLYLSGLVNVTEFINKIRNDTGYFYLNSAIALGATKALTILTLICVFGLTFMLGIIISNSVRKYRR